MNSRKKAINSIAIITEMILQLRNRSFDQKPSKNNIFKQKIHQIHQNISTTKELTLHSLLKHQQQYGIQQKLNSKQYRLNTSLFVTINFKLTSKQNRNYQYFQSWLVSVYNQQPNKMNPSTNFNQDFHHLFEEVYKYLQRQFSRNSVRQVNSKYIFDYEIHFNDKKKINKLNILNYEYVWKKSAYLNNDLKIDVVCYYQPFKLSTIEAVTDQHHQQFEKFQDKIKSFRHASQQTKPSNSNSHNSGQYQLTVSVGQRPINKEKQKKRKTSLIQFYDHELDITVLSNDSDSMRQSLNKKFNGTLSELILDKQQSDEEFELLFDEQFQQKYAQQQSRNMIIVEIEKQIESILQSLDNILIF